MCSKGVFLKERKKGYNTKGDVIEALKEFIETMERDTDVCEASDKHPYTLHLSGTVVLGAEPAVWVGTVVYQSRCGTAFSREGRCFKASNGVVLSSISFPSFMPFPSFEGDVSSFYVRGEDTKSDTLTVYIPVEFLPAIAKAVLEYNQQ